MKIFKGRTTDMSDDNQTMNIPAIATMPLPELPQPNGNGVHDEHAEAIARAAMLVDNFKQEREKLQQLLAEATQAIKETRRENELLKLDLLQARNDLCTVQSTLESQRQEASDYRAIFQSFKAQLEHFEVPLPIRKRVAKKNGEKIAGEDK